MLIGRRRSLSVDPISDFKDSRIWWPTLWPSIWIFTFKNNQSHKKPSWGLPCRRRKHFFIPPFSQAFLPERPEKVRIEWEGMSRACVSAQRTQLPTRARAFFGYGNNPKRKPFSRPFNCSRWDPTKKASTLGKSSLFTNDSVRGILCSPSNI